MNTKHIEKIIVPPTPGFVGDGFRVHHFIPSHDIGMRRMDPFLVMDYNSKFHFEGSVDPKGVGVHPHRGFETVTLAYKGKIAHHDSSGGGGIIGEGDVQWMTAASGVLHKEYHETEFNKTGGEFQMVQLWVNLPAKYKMSEPKYQSITNDSIPLVTLSDNSGIVEVVAGVYNGVQGIAETFSPVHMFNAKLNAGGKANFNFPAHYNTAMLIIEGSAKINGENVPTDHFVLFGNQGEDIEVIASEDAVILVLSGAPLKEPIAAYGPFVMNSQEEIMQAYQDYNMGKFGYLED